MGNLIDTADVYSGRRERSDDRRFPHKRGVRGRMVIATTSEFPAAIGHPTALAALASVRGRPGVSSVLMGASQLEQVRENASLDTTLTMDRPERLDVERGPPHLDPIFSLTCLEGAFSANAQ